MVKFNITSFLVLLSILFLTNCDGDPDVSEEQCSMETTFTDSRDGQTYKVIQIGNQCWLAENLNFETENSFCFNDEEDNCNTFGRLYKWEDAIIACPPGWHLPTNDEWIQLANALGGLEVSGGKLKETGLLNWIPPNAEATNESGFNALPSGFRGSGGSYEKLGNDAYYWTATDSEVNNSLAIYRGLNYNNGKLGEYTTDKRFSFAIRCVKD